MIVGDFGWSGRKLRFSITAVYRPLVGALFPEIAAEFGAMTYSGFRVLRRDLPVGDLPAGFGVETHLNVMSAVRGWRVRTIHVGEYAGPVRSKPALGWEVGAAILDA